MKRRPLAEKLVLLILAVAAALRLFDFRHLPFMHDELSALIRAQAPGLSQLIGQARDSDVHPVGIHVFLHYWSAIAGEQEWLIKLPFIIMSVAAIWFAFAIATKWFGEACALLLAASMAGLQYFVMYGQLARPYASGLFFTMVMVWCWTNYLSGYKRKWLAGFVITAVLCSYDHYFALMFAGMVGITGIFFCDRKKLPGYLSACLLVVLLFLPHLPITIHQFSAANSSDVKWIPKPEAGWLYHFIKYLFHYSFTMYLAAALVLICGIIFSRTRPPLTNRFRIICFSWFLVCFLTIFLYSRYKEPALQLSSLMFCTPFLLMGVFSFVGELSPPSRLVLPLILLAAGGFTLVRDRKHYEIFYAQPYEQMARMSTEEIGLHGARNVTVAHSVMDGFMEYYQKKYGDFDFYRVTGKDLKEFRKFVERSSAEYFVAGNLEDEYLSVIREKYPVLLRKKESFTTWVYCFAKEGHQTIPEPHVYDSRRSPLKDCGGFWNTGSRLLMDSATEYSCGFKDSLINMIDSRYNVIHAGVRFISADSSSNPLLVMEISDGDKQLSWKGSTLRDFTSTDSGMVYVSMPLRDIDPAMLRRATIKLYIWNRDHRSLVAKNAEIYTKPGNPYIYGLYEPFR